MKARFVGAELERDRAGGRGLLRAWREWKAERVLYTRLTRVPLQNRGVTMGREEAARRSTVVPRCGDPKAEQKKGMRLSLAAVKR